MALRKHDSMVVSEIISAFTLLGTFAIALMLFLIHQDFSAQHMAPEKTSQKVSAEDLDPAFVGELSNALTQLNVSQKMSNQEIAFFMNKLLEKDFSKEEVKGLSDEFKAIRQKQADDAKAAAAQQQAGQTAPAAAPEAAPAQ